MTLITFAPYGTDAPAGRYRCVDCGFEIATSESGPLMPCPKVNASPHEKRGWEILEGHGVVPPKEG